MFAVRLRVAEWQAGQTVRAAVVPVALLEYSESHAEAAAGAVLHRGTLMSTTKIERADWLVITDGLYWQHNAMGYTSDLLKAGLFTKRKAKAYARNKDRRDTARPLSAFRFALEERQRTIVKLLALLPPAAPPGAARGQA